MYQHARDLEFEQAARLRDEINELRGQGLGFPKRAEEEPRIAFDSRGHT